jgi:uncharacterized protein (TIGR03437 family)
VLNLLPNNNSSSAPVLTSVINGASLAGGPVSPGEIIAIQGTGLSSNDPTTFAVDATGMLAKTLGNTQVFFDGAPAALLYVRSNQINLIVPYSVIPGTSVNVSVAYQGTLSNPIAVPVVSASPGLFTAGGQNQAAILNRDRSINSPDNPAAGGEVVTIYATGAGQTIPPGIDGQIEGPTPVPILPVSITIGGIDSAVVSANLMEGMLVISAKVPANSPSGSAVPLVLAVGNVLGQSGVVMAVK